MTRALRLGATFVSLICGITAAAPMAGATSGQNGLHDPSRMIASNGKVYVFSTGGGSIVSSDGMVWSSTPAPPWNGTLLANNDRPWAPDGVYLNGQFFIYYAYWRDSDKSSAVALLTTPTLDPASPNHKWTDRGVAVAGPAGVTHSVIDPGPVVDASGNLWVVWGGGYPFNSASNSVFVTRMDNSTGLPLTTDPGWKPPASPGYAIETGHKEGPAIYYHGGYYYLFWQTGNAFNPGTSYQINMARATAITGPYSGDRVFYSKNPGPGIYGPGHMGIYSCNGVERFTYHFYSNDTNSGSSLGENALTWGSDGWPVAGAVSTTGFTPCTPEGSSGTGTSGGGGAVGTGGTGNAPGGGGGAGGIDAGTIEPPSGTGGSTTGTGGSGTGGSGTGGSATGGAIGSGGQNATGGSPGPSGSGGTSGGGETTNGGSSGCSCMVDGRGQARTLWTLAALAGLVVVLRRRRSG